ncbi:MAG: carboxypeptidase-like regulatory domain-containing protein, partial [Acidobacteria bacterium]|nr:carboxypeptidase-like regulatory domain-containing protein [Acidobacteriota bacterium]
MPRRFVVLLSVLLPALLFVEKTSIAQEASAGITGTITDPSGAAIAGASITVRDQDRGTTWSTKTNAEGIYALPRIPPGTYEMRIEAQGFRTAVRRELALELNARARVDVAMELGAVAETVEVSGTAALLQTETTQVGTVISGTTNVNLPLNGRNFVQLAILAAGSTTVNPAGFTSGRRTSGGGRPYVNGNREEANNFLLDGIDNNNANSNMVTYQPNVDAIQEFKMITNNAPAEFGNYQGAIVNISIRSGTNSFHGSAFEFLRNDKLNANAWNRNWQGTNRESVRHNVFGGTVGGRIIRDKVFFFVDYEGTRRANPGAPDSVTLIPMDFRNGDLSRLLTERNTQLYDPLSTNSAGDRQPLPNNQIPAARIDPVARNLFSMPDVYPVPMNSALRFNALNTGSSYVYTDQGDIKIDAKPSSRDDFSARYSISKHDAPGRNTIPALLNTFFTSPFQAGVVNWTHTFGPSLVNELRAGVNRSIFNDGGDPGGVGNLAEGLGIARGNERGPGLMLLAFQGGLSTNLGNQNNGALRINVNNTYHYADNLTVVRGRHMMKTGGQFLRVQSNVFYAGNNGRTGFMRYTGQYTSGPNANRPVSKGLAEADFILGYPTRLGRGVDSGLWGQRKIIVGSYFQDDWRVSAGLTLNLGLRWEYHSPLVEVADRQSNFEMLTGKLLLAGKDGASRGLYESYTRGWQPRVGFAWTPAFLGRNTVLRGAYTISSYMEGTGVNSRLPMNPPFVGEFEAIYEGQPQVASTSAQGLTVLKAQDPWKGATLRMWDPYVRPANSQQWSFFIERQLPGENFFSLGYVGQHGTHLMLFAPYFQRRLLPG